MTETQVQRILRIAQAEVGYHEGRTGSTWNNHQKYSPAVPGLEWSQNQAWCATFVSWLALKAGLADLYPRTASCDVAGQWFKTRGRWSEYPAIGAQVFYGSSRDLNHTGLVVDFDDTYIWTVEGNTNTSGSAQGDGVYKQKRVRRSTNVVGYGYPKFTAGIKTADPDPKWKSVAKPIALPAQPDKPATEPPATAPVRYAGDYSTARPNLAALRKAGVRGLGRYLTSENPESKKPLTRAEANAILAADLWYFGIFESTAGRAGQGRAAGVSDAKRAEAAADAIGYPKGAAIFYAVDYDADPAKVAPYFEGILSAAKRPVGDYGSYRVIEASKVPWHWQTEAWSKHKVSPKAHLLQKVGHQLKPTGVPGDAWDENLILHGKIPVHLPPAKKPSTVTANPPVVVVTPPIATTPPPAPAPPPAPPVVTKRALKVVTWNGERDRLPATVLHELQQLVKVTDADVLLLQEMNDYKTVLAKVPGYTRVALYAHREQGEACMLVRNGLKVDAVSAPQITSDPDGKGPLWAGWATGKTTRTPAKYATLATVEGFPMVSYHTAPSVQSKLLRATHPRQWRSYQESQQKIARILSLLGPRALVAADWNWDARKDDGSVSASPKATLTRLHMTRSFPGAGTVKGNRSIDGFGVKGGVLTGTRVVPGFTSGSDHKPAETTLTYEL